MDAGDTGSYDLQRYGKLDYNKVPKQFCRDLDKKECIDTVSEENLMSGLINKPNEVIIKDSAGNEDKTAKYVFLNAPKEEGGFCVPMACRGKKLKFDKSNGQVKECTDEEVKKGECFSLDSTYYPFGEIVVIKNVGNNPDDFSGKNINNISIPEINKYVIHGDTKHSFDKICGSNYDIYSKGGVEAYDYRKFLLSYPLKYFSLTMNESKRDEVESCFDRLVNANEVKKVKVAEKQNYQSIGYQEVANFGNGELVMVKYKPDSGDSLAIKKIYNSRATFWRNC